MGPAFLRGSNTWLVLFQAAARAAAGQKSFNVDRYFISHHFLRELSGEVLENFRIWVIPFAVREEVQGVNFFCTFLGLLTHSPFMRICGVCQVGGLRPRFFWRIKLIAFCLPDLL
jgi:hypothetical protein